MNVVGGWLLRSNRGCKPIHIMKNGSNRKMEQNIELRFEIKKMLFSSLIFSVTSKQAPVTNALNNIQTIVVISKLLSNVPSSDDLNFTFI